jgi:hypothetical protein
VCLEYIMKDLKLIFFASVIALLCLARGGVARAQAPGQAQPTAWVATAPAQNSQVDTSDDEGISGGRVLGEVLVGGLTGIAGALAGGAIGHSIEDCSGEDNSFCGTAGTLIGGYAGYATGVAVGVYVVGSGGDHEGSLVATLGGSALGGLSAIVLTAASEGDAFILLPLAPIAGALIGFHATSKRRAGNRESAPVMGSLINLDEGKASLGLPMVSMARAPEGGGHSTFLHLAGGRL